ncbi:MAG: hypothetical protein A2007_04890 [Verrucomicrobia bacterium GWC2_42_7]|nr:MAG: hypothetical protein A2007_04890 [Verrucomicrobia bacterium GWC2_42_7]
MHEKIVQDHLDVCEETYALLLEENGLLRHQEKGLDSTFLEKKQLLLEKLEKSVIALQEMNKEKFAKTEKFQNLINATQKKLMKIFLLDRENEQLLLKFSLQAHAATNIRPITTQHIQKIYKE